MPRTPTRSLLPVVDLTRKIAAFAVSGGTAPARMGRRIAHGTIVGARRTELVNPPDGVESEAWIKSRFKAK